MKPHHIETLPKWTQKMLQAQDREIARLQALRQAHEILSDPDSNWFTVRNIESEGFVLFRLFRDQAQAICSLGPGDILIVGRAKRD